MDKQRETDNRTILKTQRMIEEQCVWERERKREKEREREREREKADRKWYILLKNSQTMYQR